ncbi:MAG: hypothetical protein ACLU3U_01805 [Gallintestinimicrobium sp.]
MNTQLQGVLITGVIIFFIIVLLLLKKKIAFVEIHIIMAFGRAGNGNYGIIS